ncbi:hypothetical protein [Pontibacter flavimaris]|uniref:Uncharacterized protein n=1 Tax=Pontibacter flavimaris TaxID=1797110 RepID=A0A1Q5PBU8_9BACT|nr:hypothetical protein [Pontibacter flavimaris]OKL39673.1 hypothetical protein A3841_00095 [Pontibacter flavimaris]
MQNRKYYRVIMAIACFVFAGLNAYRVYTGNYSTMDVFLLVVFLVFGAIYLFLIFKKDKPE